MDRMSFQPGELKQFIKDVESKVGLSADNLGKLVSLSGRTVRDWKREKFYPSKEAIMKLSKLSGVSVPKYKLLPRYWYVSKGAGLGGKRRFELYGDIGTKEGRSRGGRSSWLKRRTQSEIWEKYTKLIYKPEESRDLAEFIGTMLGDGGLTSCQCSVYLNSEIDKEYAGYVSQLIERLFKVKPKIYQHHKDKVLRVSVSGVNLVKYLTTKGLLIGNKVSLQVGVPQWIRSKLDYVQACIRGLVDTDGTFIIHRYKVSGKEYFYPKMAFSNKSKPILNFVYDGLEELGFTPKENNQSQVWIYNQDEVKSYLQQVGVRNYKPMVKKILEGCLSG